MVVMREAAQMHRTSFDERLRSLGGDETAGVEYASGMRWQTLEREKRRESTRWWRKTHARRPRVEARTTSAEGNVHGSDSSLAHQKKPSSCSEMTLRDTQRRAEVVDQRLHLTPGTRTQLLWHPEQSTTLRGTCQCWAWRLREKKKMRGRSNQKRELDNLWLACLRL